MRKVFNHTVLFLGLAGLLHGCVTTGNPSGEEDTAASTEADRMEATTQESAETPQEEQMEPAPDTPPEPPVNPCVAVIEDLADQARVSMKTVYGTCQEKRIEVNPMWALQYDGSVRIRVLDQEGGLVETEVRKP